MEVTVSWVGGGDCKGGGGGFARGGGGGTTVTAIMTWRSTPHGMRRAHCGAQTIWSLIVFGLLLPENLKKSKTAPSLPTHLLRCSGQSSQFLKPVMLSLCRRNTLPTNTLFTIGRFHSLLHSTALCSYGSFTVHNRPTAMAADGSVHTPALCNPAARQ